MSKSPLTPIIGRRRAEKERNYMVEKSNRQKETGGRARGYRYIGRKSNNIIKYPKQKANSTEIMRSKPTI